MDVSDQPAGRHIAHDVLDRLECLVGIGLVVHREEDSRHDLNHQHHQRQRAEVVPEVEVLRRVIFAELAFPERVTGRRSSIQLSSAWAFVIAYAPLPLSSPTTSRASPTNRYGGTTRLRGAGTPFSTRPARSNLDPWQGQKKPPSQSGPRPLRRLPGAWRSASNRDGCRCRPDQIFRFDRAIFVLRIRRLLGTSEAGRPRWRPSSDVFEHLRRTIDDPDTLPRHSTLIIRPGSTFEMSTSTGAPAAFARSLGQNDITNGVAVATTPTPPTTLVAPIRKRRFPLSTVASVAMRRVPFVSPRVGNESGAALETGLVAKPIDYTGLCNGCRSFPVKSLESRPAIRYLRDVPRAGARLSSRGRAFATGAPYNRVCIPLAVN